MQGNKYKRSRQGILLQTCFINGGHQILKKEIWQITQDFLQMVIHQLQQHCNKQETYSKQDNSASKCVHSEIFTITRKQLKREFNINVITFVGFGTYLSIEAST